MRVDRQRGAQERTILIGMITNGHVLRSVRKVWKKDMFQSPWCNLIGQWCVAYYDRHKEPPGRHVLDMYANWAAQNQNKEVGNLIDRFLSGLSDEYERGDGVNSRFTVELAAKHFNAVTIRRVIEQCEEDLQSGNAEKGLERLERFRRVNLGREVWKSPIEDMNVPKSAFEVSNEVLIEYPGDLGKFFQRSLSRDSLVVFEAIEKRGKSWWLMDMAYRALCQHRRVAYFEAGDMTERQWVRRFGVRVTGLPLFPGTIKVPVDLTKDPDDMMASVTHDEREYEEAVTGRKMFESCKKLLRTKIKGKDRFRLNVRSAGSLEVNEIIETLQIWGEEGWPVDVVMIDYADILAPPRGVQEIREQTNQNWMGLRRLSQELHCLVVTATQASAQGYRSDTLSMRTFSEDKRKHAHVTGMIGINATEGETADGIYRLNWIALREEKKTRPVHVASCLGLGRPAMRSTF